MASAGSSLGPRSRSSNASRSVPSIQSIAITYRSSTKKSSRTSGSRMRAQREQEPRLREQMDAGGLVGHGPDLQRDLATVEVIERPDQLALAAPSGHFE